MMYKFPSLLTYVPNVTSNATVHIHRWYAVMVYAAVTRLYWQCACGAVTIDC
jgi:hypothetical protein